MDIFVQRMRSAMFLKGIRQADLAKATGFSDGQVSSCYPHVLCTKEKAA